MVNCHVSLDPLLDKQGYTYAARRLWRGLHNGEIPDDAVSHALSVLGNLGSIARAAWRKKIGRTYVNKPINGILLDVTLDPRPVPESRITLGEDTDALGMRKPHLDWRLHPEDSQSLTRTAVAVAAEITRLGLGRVQLHPALADPAAAWVESGHLVGHDGAPESPTTFISWHHMGTTRMAADPGQGVVDAHCRVHGVGNLFIAGSSVFPTTGSANPTLTIVALALRLADHLRAASRA